MKEKDIQVLFKQNVETFGLVECAAFELKLCKLKSLPFDSVRDIQVESLKKVKHGLLYHKIADQPMSWLGGTGYKYTIPKPFDCFVLIRATAFIVIVYYEPRQPKRAIFIDIDRWIEEKLNSDRKSLTEARAMEIATRVETLKSIKK